VYAATVLLPLLGSFLAGCLAFAPAADEDRRHRLDALAQSASCGALILAAVLAVPVFIEVVGGGNPRTVELFTFIDSGALEVSWALKFDSLSAVMVLMVTVVSSLIHVYSIGYMHGDPSVPRFMSYLSLFTFFMLMLVTADNLVQLYFGWEGVGLCSYFLIGFWYDRPSANAAAIKAFVVNRVGDFGFGLGIFAAFVLFQSIHFDTIFAAAPGKAAATLEAFGGEFHALTVICLLLFVGAMGKSAQLGLHTWLPDAMEGPTPVSALIHAATMVTAGVFMVARLSPLFEHSETALAAVAFVGASTAFMTATIACVQNDIKRVIAYSTCSQLGYMFFACGVSAYGAGMFHLITHAFFKALLFLGAGSVIHAMSAEQDMRKMGGIWRLVPWTYAVMWIGSLAAAGIFPFSGYWSKDVIVESAYAAATGIGAYAFALGVATAFLTAFYTWRLLYMTFHGPARADEKVMAHVHESPWVMIGPLLGLAAGAVVVGWVGYDFFVGDEGQRFWGASLFVLPEHPALEQAHHVPLWVKLLPSAMAVGGILFATLLYVAWPGLADLMVERARGLHRFLLNKWYFDELYDVLFVRPAFYLGSGFWRTGDGTLIDGVGPDGVAAATRLMARRVAALQSGYLYHYAFAMLVGVVSLISWYLLTRGR
jgi:NADH-quinone oxidoreductase subunit L